MNEQKPLARLWDNDGLLVVHSYFHTIQGEGPFAGQPAFFVRLNGCNLQCPGCDTEYTEQREYLTSDKLSKMVFAAVRQERGQLIVITGGEPFRQNITPVVNALLELGLLVQIETNGVFDPGESFPWGDEGLTVVCSPKTGRINSKVAALADAYKYVLREGDVAGDGLPISALGHPLGNFPHVARPPEGWDGPIYLQPMDEQDETKNFVNTQAVVASVMQHRMYIMGVQMHKLTGLP